MFSMHQKEVHHQPVNGRTQGQSGQAAPYHAVDLNNKAANEIANGNFSLSSKILTSALEIVKSSARGATAAAPLSQDRPSKGASCSCSCSFTDTIRDDSHQSYFLFSQPIRVHIQEQGLKAPSRESLETLSYAVVYNFAICFHLRAISSMGIASHQRFLRQALGMYNQAQKLLRCNNTMAVNALHSLALVNNLGHAHHMLQNRRSAKQCFQHLLRAIMSISHAHQQGELGEGEEVHQDNLDGFLSNIMTVMGSASVAAPAA